jgi:hypothetical protein
MRRDQLTDFPRRRREAIRPAEAGSAGGSRRRTTGLRREEVAMLARTRQRTPGDCETVTNSAEEGPRCRSPVRV